MEQTTMKQTWDSFMEDAKKHIINDMLDEESEIIGRFPFGMLIEIVLLGSPEEVLNASLRDAVSCKIPEMLNEEWDPFEIIEKKAEQGDERCIRLIEKFEKLEGLFSELFD